jgi:hypothetical protein
MLIEPVIAFYTNHFFSETTKGMLNKIWDIMNENHPDLIEIVAPLDIISKVKLIETLIRDVNDEIKVQHTEIPKSLELSIQQLNDIINKIHKNLNDIKDGIEYHKTLWFSSLRTATYLKDIETLTKNNSILDTRLDHLIKIIMLFRKKE